MFLWNQESTSLLISISLESGCWPKKYMNTHGEKERMKEKVIIMTISRCSNVGIQHLETFGSTKFREVFISCLQWLECVPFFHLTPSHSEFQGLLFDTLWFHDPGLILYPKLSFKWLQSWMKRMNKRHKLKGIDTIGTFIRKLFSHLFLSLFVKTNSRQYIIIKLSSNHQSNHQSQGKWLLSQ